MDAEVIAIGTELTRGAKLDTNSQWLSIALAEMGVTVHWHVTVADDLDRIAAAFRTAADRSDLAIITGGLGPTRDDLTRDALAVAFDRPLELDEGQLDHIRELFASRGRTMAERNQLQAMFPVGAVPIPNPIGTAPGIWLEVARTDRPDNACRFAALPGVPTEMKRMYAEFVRTRLPEPKWVIRTARINIFGAGESEVEQRLGDLTARDRSPEVGITAHEGTITLRIVASGTSPADCDRQIEAVRQIAVDRLGEMVFGEEDTELEHVVAEQLARTGLTLAIAEAATAGLVAHRLLATDAEEDSLLQAATLSTAGFLRFARTAAEESEASCETTSEMATAVAREIRRETGADFGLAVSPFEADDAGKGLRAVAIALASESGVEVIRHVPVGDWSIARSRAAKAALDPPQR